MNLPRWCCVLGLVTSIHASDVIGFDQAETGKTPAGWLTGQTGKGQAHWVITNDPTAPTPPQVLRQDGQATFPVALEPHSRLTNGFVEVRFKAISGTEDQAAGVVWRATDLENYYVARANALENNVRIYHVLKGKRTQFGGADARVESGQWHTLRVQFSGAHFTVWFNGRELFRATDGTFPDAGKVGVWTKADSVTHFDNFNFGTSLSPK